MQKLAHVTFEFMGAGFTEVEQSIVAGSAPDIIRTNASQLRNTAKWERRKDHMTWDQVINLARKMTRTDGGLSYKGLDLHNAPRYLPFAYGIFFTDHCGQSFVDTEDYACDNGWWFFRKLPLRNFPNLPLPWQAKPCRYRGICLQPRAVLAESALSVPHPVPLCFRVR